MPVPLKRITKYIFIYILPKIEASKIVAILAGRMKMSRIQTNIK
jgi:hypothetical protein